MRWCSRGLRFHALRLYFGAVQHQPAISDDELVRIRTNVVETDVAEYELIPSLVEFMLSEHLAAYFFRRLAEQAREPVLVDLLTRIAADEVRHAQSAADLIEKRIAQDPAVIPQILDAATAFQHFGCQAIGEVPVDMPGDVVAIRTFAKRIERLCKVRLVDHLKAAL